jgi:hypothetical protein
MPWLLVLFLNAVPVYGVLVHGWSVGSLMLLLAIEYSLQAAAMWIRIRHHERRSGDPHYLDPANLPEHISNGERRRYRSHAAAFAPMVFVVSGTFLLMLGLAAPLAFAKRWPAQEALWLPRMDDVLWPAVAIALAIGVALASEWRTLPRRSAASIHAQAEQLRLRAASIAVTVLAGLPAVSKLESPLAWLAVQLLCKTGFDLWLAVQTATDAPVGPRAPASLSERLAAMRRRAVERERHAEKLQARPPDE